MGNRRWSGCTTRGPAATTDHRGPSTRRVCSPRSPGENETTAGRPPRLPRRRKAAFGPVEDDHPDRQLRVRRRRPRGERKVPTVNERPWTITLTTSDAAEHELWHSITRQGAVAPRSTGIAYRCGGRRAVPDSGQRGKAGQPTSAVHLDHAHRPRGRHLHLLLPLHPFHCAARSIVRHRRHRDRRHGRRHRDREAQSSSRSPADRAHVGGTAFRDHETGSRQLNAVRSPT